MRVLNLVLCGLLLSLSACSSCNKTSGPTAAKEDMQLVPKESDIVLMANLARARTSAMWKKITDVRDSDEKSKKDYDDFVQRCGLDPLQQIDSLFVALPQGVDQTKEFAAILRGTFNEDKLVQCAKDQAKKDGSGDVATSEYNGKKIYTDTKQGITFASFIDGKTVAIGGKEWIKKVIDLAAGKDIGGSAKQNTELMALVARAKSSDAIWGAGVVPQSVRDGLKNDPHLSSAATMKAVLGSIDFASGFVADVNIDTGSEADAKDLAAKVTAQLTETRKNPQVMMMGMATFIDGVKIDSKGPTFHVAISYTQPQVDDLINRVKGLVKSFGGAFGGGGGMPPTPPSPTP
jgi:hypothetical protein